MRECIRPDLRADPPADDDTSRHCRQIADQPGPRAPQRSHRWDDVGKAEQPDNGRRASG